MLEYDRTDIYEGVDVNETNLFVTWYFKDIGFKYKLYLCNNCYDLMQKAKSFNNIAIVYVKENAYKIIFWYMSKDYVINIMNGCIVTDKRGAL